MWRLPFDVMCGIIVVSQRSTISTLMKSCNALYTEGPRHLLHDGVDLHSARQITLFAGFMLTNHEDPPRFAYFGQLSLSIQPLLDLSTQMQLSALLGHCSLAPETLILPHAETMLKGDVPPAILFRALPA